MTSLPASRRCDLAAWGCRTDDYGFLLSAIDGSPDRFRMKIWDKDAGAAVVYDNQVVGDTGDDANPTTALGGGRIVIHTGKK